MTSGRNRMRTLDSATRRRFQQLLLRWFATHQRDLPWRKNADPYRVWLSEVMLQQTRVVAVVEHYRRFLKQFPTVKRLAAAREASVLAAWSGLGYYRRARMLHAAAEMIVRERAGKFPTIAADLRTLPGIGRYTAAAVASIAFNEPVAVVDGNVERILQRLHGRPITGEQLWKKAEELLDKTRPGDFNQALMDLGATVCLPRQPKCRLCPVLEMCATRGELRRDRKETRQKKRQVQYALDCRNGLIFLVQRPKSASLMPGMWELPEIIGPNGNAEPCLTVRHSITVTDYLVRVLPGPVPEGTDGRWVARSRLTKLPLTGLAQKILRAARVI